MTTEGYSTHFNHNTVLHTVSIRYAEQISQRLPNSTDKIIKVRQTRKFKAVGRVGIDTRDRNMKAYISIGCKNIRLIYSVDVNLYTKDDVYAQTMLLEKYLTAA